MRDSYTGALRAHVDKYYGKEPHTIADVGGSFRSMGIRYISNAIMNSKMDGFVENWLLAVAKHRDEGEPGSERRTWVHGKRPLATKMADNSVAHRVPAAFVIPG